MAGILGARRGAHKPAAAGIGENPGVGRSADPRTEARRRHGRSLWLALAVMFGIVTGLREGVAAPVERPNVIVILADDLGWTDLGCFGSDFYQSPHLDRLAADGMRFTANYSACTVCSPTRAALLTGQYPARVRVTDWIPGRPPVNPQLLVPDFNKHLPHEPTTLAEALQQRGYATASIGKWHLGEEDSYPRHHGFDVNVAGTNFGHPPGGYFAPYQFGNIEPGPPGEYLTDRLGDEAAKFIREHADGPFFLYLPHFAVHTPIQAKKPLIEKFKARVKKGRQHRNAVYAAMIESMDDTVGQIRSTLDELQIAERTIILFTSDNGGRIPTTSNAPLRNGKGSAYEGGVRVPLIVYWPGVTRPGSECPAPVITMDLYPTILEMTGTPAPVGQPCDGVSLAALLTETGTLAERPLFWHYPHYQLYQHGGTTPYGAIRRGDYKLVEFYADGRLELYNLADDRSERRNLAEPQAEKAAQLHEQLAAWRRSVDAQMPTENPNFDPAKPEDPQQGPGGG